MLVNDQKLLEESVALAIYTHPSKRRKGSNSKEKRLIDMLFNDETISKKNKPKVKKKCDFKNVDSSIAYLERQLLKS